MVARIGIFIAIIITGVALLVSSTTPWPGFTLIGIGVFRIILLGIGRYFGEYLITVDGFWEIDVKFDFPLWRKILLFGLTPSLGAVEAKVSYKEEGENY